MYTYIYLHYYTHRWIYKYIDACINMKDLVLRSSEYNYCPNLGFYILFFNLRKSELLGKIFNSRVSLGKVQDKPEYHGMLINEVPQNMT